MSLRKPLALFALLCAPLACSHEMESRAPAPALADPQIVCNEQLTKSITLTGDGFSPTLFDALVDRQRLMLPEIFLTREKLLDGHAATGTRIKIPDDPTQPAASRVRWQSQSRMGFDVFPELALEPGVYAITVRNASGREATAQNAFVVVPRPSVARVEPDLACTEQSTTSLLVTGTSFLKLGLTLPEVLIGARTYTPGEATGCVAIAGPVTNAQMCTGLRVTLAQGDFAPVAAEALSPQAVVVQNPTPAECRSTEPKRFTALPRPRVARIDADLACTEQYPNDFVVTGTDFFVIAGRKPSVAIGAKSYVPTPTGCTTLTGFDESVERCSTLAVTVPTGDLPDGAQPLVVTNPTPAGCASTNAVDLLVVPRPAVTAVEPDLVCREQLTNEITVRGHGFLTIDGIVPTVHLGATPFAGASVRALDCTPVAGRRETLARCTRLVATVPAGNLAPGANAVVVRNPAPAQCGSTDAVSLVGIGPPTITRVSRPALCLESSAQALDIVGAGFLVVGTSTPSVTLTGSDGAHTYVPTASGCAAVTGVTGAQTCTTLTISVPANTLPLGAYTLTVRNPAPAACQSNEPVTVRITAPPTLDGVAVSGLATPRICASGGSIIVTGSGFQPGAVVTINLPGEAEVSADSVVVASDGRSLTASFGATPLRASTARYAVNVRNPDGCGRSLEDVLQVTRGVFTFFADPPVVFNGVSTQITILAAGLDPLGNGPTEVRLQRAGATAIVFSGSQINWGGDDSPARPQRVRVVVAVGTPAGTYDVTMTDGTGCSSLLAGGVKVVGETRLALTGVTPPFGFRSEDTALTLLAKETSALAMGEVNFGNLPRVYLSPSNNSSGTATEARAVTFVDATRATAVAPNRSSNLAVGMYDVLVVNPTGEVGLVRSAYKVTQLPPPVIDSVAPGTLRMNPSPATARIAGRDFRQPTVRFTCRAAGSTTDVLPAINVTASSTTQITAQVTMDSLSSGMTCIVRVTNGDDGSFFDFAAVTTANPSQGANPIAFSAGPDLVTARRAPAGVASRVTRTARFVYAIGGDNGTTAGALSSVEAAPVGLFGDLGAWFTVPISLTSGNPAAASPTPTTATKRTFAGAARVGRFLYVVGGHNGTAATPSVLRAQVLTPDEAPVMGDPDLVVDEDSDVPTGGLPSGLFSYRASAVLTATQAHNPGGETLAADALLVRLPSTQFPIRLYLCWQAPTQPSGVAIAKYRIYRTRTAGEPSGAERLLAECPGSAGCAAATTCFEDNVASPTGFLDANRVPLPLGSTGVWHDVLPLPEARFAAGVGVAPINASNGGAARVSLLVAAGTSDGNTAIGSTRTLALAVDEPQLTGAGWSTGPSLPSPRSELNLFVANAVNAPRAGAATWIYAGGGQGAESTVHAAQLNTTTGALGTTTYPNWLGVDSFQGGGRVGYAAAVSNDFLYVVAGLSGGAPTNNGDKAEMCGVGQTCNGGADDPPDLVNWNNTQTGSLRARYQPGQAIQSSYWFLFGGSATGSTSASRTCDVSVLGGQP